MCVCVCVCVRERDHILSVGLVFSVDKKGTY